MTTNNQTALLPRHSAEYGPRHLRVPAALYVAAIALTQLALLVSATLISGTQWFLWHDQAPVQLAAGYSQRAGRLDCQILIWGDSSTMTGLNPAVIQGMTGLKTCNVAEIYPLQQVVGSAVPLDAYLRKNAPPRFLVASWTSAAYWARVPAWSTTDTINGTLYGLDYLERRKFLWEALKRPASLFSFDAWVLHALAVDAVKRLTGHFTPLPNVRSQRDEHMGWFQYPGPTQTGCRRV